MRHRFAYIAGLLLVIADALVLGSAWHLSAPLSLTATLAAPTIEPLLTGLYAEPSHERVDAVVAGAPLSAEVFRPTHARSALVLIREASRRERDVDALARALARRGVAVLVTADVSAEGRAAAVAYVRAWEMPAEVIGLRAFDPDDELRSPVTRAAYAWRLFRLSRSLLSS